DCGLPSRTKRIASGTNGKCVCGPGSLRRIDVPNGVRTVSHRAWLLPGGFRPKASILARARLTVAQRKWAIADDVSRPQGARRPWRCPVARRLQPKSVAAIQRLRDGRHGCE